MGANIVDHRFVAVNTLSIGDYAIVHMNGRDVLLQRVAASTCLDFTPEDDGDFPFVNPDSGAIMKVSGHTRVQFVKVAVHIQGGA